MNALNENHAQNMIIPSPSQAVQIIKERGNFIGSFQKFVMKMLLILFSYPVDKTSIVRDVARGNIEKQELMSAFIVQQGNFNP